MNEFKSEVIKEYLSISNGHLDKDILRYIKSLEKQLEDDKGEIENYWIEISNYKSEIQRLMPFVDHAVTCGKKEGLDYCTCGLDKIINQIQYLAGKKESAMSELSYSKEDKVFWWDNHVMRPEQIIKKFEALETESKINEDAYFEKAKECEDLKTERDLLGTKCEFISQDLNNSNDQLQKLKDFEKAVKELSSPTQMEIYQMRLTELTQETKTNQRHE